MRGDTTCCHNSWINSGMKGVDFDTNVANPNIDYATVHAYPDNWGIPASDYTWYGPNFIASRASIAHAAGKPIIMEEYGVREGRFRGVLGVRAGLGPGACAGAGMRRGQPVWGMPGLGKGLLLIGCCVGWSGPHGRAITKPRVRPDARTSAGHLFLCRLPAEQGHAAQLPPGEGS